MAEKKSAAFRLLDRASTAAVVLGAHDWTEAGLGRAPSFRRSAKNLVAYLYDQQGLGLDPDLILDLFDDTASAGDQLARVRDTLDLHLRERRDSGRPVLDVLVYYVGHGQTDDHGHLSLLVRRSRKGLEAETGIKAPDLARTLRLAAPHQRRSIILDCCFSEAAARSFIGMSGDLNTEVAAAATKDLRDDQPARGTLLLCSSPVGEVSMGPPNAERTLFTGAVLEVLQQGAETLPRFFSFADLRDAAYERMVVSFGANAPRPALHQANAAKGDLTRAPAFPNRMEMLKKSPVLAEMVNVPQLSPWDDLAQPDSKEEASLHDTNYLFRKALELDRAGQLSEAVVAYDAFLKSDSSNSAPVIDGEIAEALLYKASALGILEFYEESIEVLDEIVKRFEHSSNALARLQMGKALLKKASILDITSRYAESISVYKDLIKNHSLAKGLIPLTLVCEAYLGIGSILSKLGRQHEAISAYDDLIQRFGTESSSELRYLVAQSTLSKAALIDSTGRRIEAVELCDELIVEVSNSADLKLREMVGKALLLKGFILKSSEFFDGALSIYDELLLRFQDATEAPLQEQVARGLMRKVLLLNNLRKHEQAISICDDVVGRFGNASEPSLREHVAEALLSKGFTLGMLELAKFVDKEEELEVYNELLARFHPSEGPAMLHIVAEALLNKGIKLGMLSRKPEAVAVFTEIMDRFSGDPQPVVRELVQRAASARDAINSNRWPHS